MYASVDAEAELNKHFVAGPEFIGAKSVLTIHGVLANILPVLPISFASLAIIVIIFIIIIVVVVVIVIIVVVTVSVHSS